ncbi:PH domain-containing protein [Halobacterium sp. R2-5]|uniref:PH domain-containing protein n=1 Tax=Halobacterium sp. R2-5 TaxID=2715751 RepID=UPI00141E2F44|nr:PH domain-containing protein [Halobacterium sp. R2-5]NIC00155.1 hypothetical protein [Halobacterium sp. R2-5]
MFDDEEFQYAVDVKEGRVRTTTNQKLVLTDSRIIAVKKALVGLDSEDYSLGEVASVKFESGLRTAKITLQGSGIDDEYPVSKSMGRKFVNLAREQMQK